MPIDITDITLQSMANNSLLRVLFVHWTVKLKKVRRPGPQVQRSLHWSWLECYTISQVLKVYSTLQYIQPLPLF